MFDSEEFFGTEDIEEIQEIFERRKYIYKDMKYDNLNRLEMERIGDDNFNEEDNNGYKQEALRRIQKILESISSES